MHLQTHWLTLPSSPWPILTFPLPYNRPKHFWRLEKTIYVSFHSACSQVCFCKQQINNLRGVEIKKKGAHINKFMAPNSINRESTYKNNGYVQCYFGLQWCINTILYEADKWRTTMLCWRIQIWKWCHSKHVLDTWIHQLTSCCVTALREHTFCSSRKENKILFQIVHIMCKCGFLLQLMFSWLHACNCGWFYFCFILAHVGSIMRT